MHGNNVAAAAARAVSAVSVLFVYSAVVVLLLFPATASAQTPEENSSDQSTPQPSQTPRSSQWQWSFSLRNRTGHRLDKPRVLQMSRNIFDARGVYKINPDWRITVEARAHYDPVNRLGFPRGVWVDPRQAIIDGKAGRVDLRLGLQQVVWGESDGLRVLDIINPLDYREFILEDFLDSRRPLWAARADAPIAGGSLQMIYAPYFAPGRLPGPDAEFGLGDPFGVALIGAAMGDGGPLPFTIRSENTARPGYRLSSGQGGARFRRSIGAWDVTANYYYGWEDIPTSYLGAITLEPGAALPIITLRPRYDRKEVFGLTGATNFGPLVVRAEAGWNRLKPAPVNNDADGDGFEKVGQFSGVVGVDYSPHEWVWLSGQYFLQFASAPQANLLFPRYNHLASFFIRTNFFREKFRPELFILTGLNQRQYMIRPRITRTIGDRWSIGFGADFLGGRPITGFGYFGSRDRIVLEIKRAW
jgi:hypothetical protein